MNSGAVFYSPLTTKLPAIIGLGECYKPSFATPCSLHYHRRIITSIQLLFDGNGGQLVVAFSAINLAGWTINIWDNSRSHLKFPVNCCELPNSRLDTLPSVVT